MRRAVVPILATGVVLSGAAVVVANPIVSAPADIRVSVIDLHDAGNELDILDPYFLESIGAVRPGWPPAVATLDILLSSLAKNPSTVSPEVLAEAIRRASEVGPPIVPSYSVETGGGPSAPSKVITDPTESTVVALRALANLSSGFAEAGVTLAQQVGMVPAVILKLSEQVLDGTLPPDEALRRLTAASFESGLTGITGDPRIDAVFEKSVIRPILEALGDAMEPPPEPANAAGVNATPDMDPPAGEPSNTAAVQSQSETPAEVNGRPALDEGGPRATGEDPGGTDDGGSGRITDSPGYRPGDITRGIRDRIHTTLEDLDRTVERLTEADQENVNQDGEEQDGEDPGGDTVDDDPPANTEPETSPSS